MDMSYFSYDERKGQTITFDQPIDEVFESIYGKSHRERNTFKKITKLQREILNINSEAFGKPQNIVLIRYKKNIFYEYNKDFAGFPESFHGALVGDFKFYAENLGHTVKKIGRAHV